MKFSVITPNYNGETYLEATIASVLKQREAGISVEYIVVDGNSTDGSSAILDRYERQIDVLIREDDTGAANAINKGFACATGDVVSWLNADDIYWPGTLPRVVETFTGHPDASFCFGRCPIINEEDEEIRKGITRFKEMFFPVSSRFVFQSINYVSQPSLFIRGTVLDALDGYLREDMVAAWDYELFLRLWRHGRGVLVPGGPLAAFRWHSGSISGQFFRTQFKEELDVALEDAGKWSPQAFLHRGVRLGIIGAYSAMARMRTRSGAVHDSSAPRGKYAVPCPWRCGGHRDLSARASAGARCALSGPCSHALYPQ